MQPSQGRRRVLRELRSTAVFCLEEMCLNLCFENTAFLLSEGRVEELNVKSGVCSRGFCSRATAEVQVRGNVGLEGCAGSAEFRGLLSFSILLPAAS